MRAAGASCRHVRLSCPCNAFNLHRHPLALPHRCVHLILLAAAGFKRTTVPSGKGYIRMTTDPSTTA